MAISYRFKWGLSGALVLMLLVGLSGCGGGHDAAASVAGEVLLDDKPLSAGTILFLDSARGAGATADIVDGRFTMPNKMLVGEYTVAVQPPPAPAPHEEATGTAGPKFPAKYSSAEKSGLTAKLEPGENELVFKINSRS